MAKQRRVYGKCAAILVDFVEVNGFQVQSKRRCKRLGKYPIKVPKRGSDPRTGPTETKHLCRRCSMPFLGLSDEEGR